MKNAAQIIRGTTNRSEKARLARKFSRCDGCGRTLTAEEKAREDDFGVCFSCEPKQ